MKTHYVLFAALALAGVAGSNQILVDKAAATELRTEWALTTDPDLVDLRGERVAAEILVGRRDSSTELTT